jgi:hypothetical protein
LQNSPQPEALNHTADAKSYDALGHKPGLLLCSWPKGKKPAMPFVYGDEVWTGIEYEVAAHLIAEGMIEEGLTIVRYFRRRKTEDSIGLATEKVNLVETQKIQPLRPIPNELQFANASNGPQKSSIN